MRALTMLSVKRRIMTAISFLILILMPPSHKTSGVAEDGAWINGYSRTIGGETMTYRSCHPEANSALLIRCLNDSDAVEWETDPVPQDFAGRFAAFTWIAGYSTGTSTAAHTFHLFLNGRIIASFRTNPNDAAADWIVKGEAGAELSFKFAKADAVNDFFGYMSLRLPSALVKNGEPLRLKVTGDATGSKDWYMTFQYPLTAKIRITPEPVIQKMPSGGLRQRVQISIDHFGKPEVVRIKTDGKEALKGTLGLGMNDFYVAYPPAGAPVQKIIEVEKGGAISRHEVILNPVRKFTLYLLPHSHVDIGYTALQTEVEKLQMKYIDDAIELAQRTADYPEGARFKWNVEVLWPVDGYLREASPKKRQAFIEAVRKGWIGLDGLYANILTGLCRPEELFRMLDFSNRLEDLTGIKIESAMISDIPGYTWGVVPAMAENGIKYFSVGANQFDRIGYTNETWGDKPFWWTSPSGRERVLVWVASQGYSWFHNWILSRGDISPLVKYLDNLTAQNYPYDIIPLRYSIGGDNGYPDSDLADFVKRWNEGHETPQFRIATTTEVFREFEAKFADKLPSLSGDFTPYWEDGAASSARETAMNRRTAERLTQLEVFYSLLDSAAFPAAKFAEAWRNVLLYSEHTWGAHNSISEPEIKFVKDQWNIKKSFAEKGNDLANEIYDMAGGLIRGAVEKKEENVLIKSGPPEQAPRKSEGKDVSQGSAAGAATGGIIGEVNSVQVANTNSWDRTDLVTIPGDWKTAGDAVVDAAGKPVPSQRLTTGELVFVAKDIPALGSKVYKFAGTQKDFGKSIAAPAGAASADRAKASAGAVAPGSISVDGNSISNEFYRVRINAENGVIESVIRTGESADYVDTTTGPGLNEYVYTGKNAADPRGSGEPVITVKENGPVLASLLVESDAPGCNMLSREVRAISGLDKIEFINAVDKKKIYDKESVRFAFPFGINDPEVRLDIAWSVVRPEADQIEGANKNYFTVQRWADVSGGGRGMTLATVDAPLLEIGGMTGEAWMSEPGRRWMKESAPSSLLYSWAMNNSWHTNYKAEQEGTAVFRYALRAHKKFDHAQAYRFGVEQSQPLVVIPAEAKGSSLSSPFQLAAGSPVAVTSIRPSRDGQSLLVRLYNPTPIPQRAAIQWKKGPAPRAAICTADETEIGALPGEIDFEPFDVKTIKIYSPAPGGRLTSATQFSRPPRLSPGLLP